MKKLLVIAAMALSSAAMAMTLQEAKGQIPAAISDSAKMTEIMKGLNDDEQIEFLALVNAAIGEMNGSADELASLYLSVNEAALKAHGANNLQALLGTTYATVPPEALTVLNEQLAKDLFNRNADPTRPVSDADFAALAKEAMETIATRTSDADNSAARTAFAMLMFIRASEGTPADLRQTLAETITDPAARELALNEWIPSALGEGGVKTYDPILGASDASTNVPTPENVLVIGRSQEIVPLLADLSSETVEDFEQSAAFGMENVGLPGFNDPTALSSTATAIPGTAWDPRVKRGSSSDSEYVEPEFYPYQRAYR